MIATAFWRRLDISGRDAAILSHGQDGYTLSGQAVFLDPRGPTALNYILDVAPDWSTRAGRVEGFIGDRSVKTHIIRSDGGWLINKRECGMAGVLDLDLGFTPATNMVQLRRVALAIGEDTEFDVAWLDAGEGELTRLPQEYRRISDREYRYASPTFGYDATIVLAENGFASVYPGLWEIES